MFLEKSKQRKTELTENVQMGKTKIWNLEYEELKNRKGLFDNKFRLIRNRDTNTLINTLNKH